MDRSRLVNAGLGLVTAIFVFYFVTDRRLSGLNILIFFMVFGGVWGLLALESGRKEKDRR